MLILVCFLVFHIKSLFLAYQCCSFKILNIVNGVSIPCYLDADLLSYFLVLGLGLFTVDVIFGFSPT